MPQLDPRLHKQMVLKAKDVKIEDPKAIKHMTLTQELQILKLKNKNKTLRNQQLKNKHKNLARLNHSNKLKPLKHLEVPIMMIKNIKKPENEKKGYKIFWHKIEMKLKDKKWKINKTFQMPR